jgi:rare lipoprotein A
MMVSGMRVDIGMLTALLVAAILPGSLTAETDGARVGLASYYARSLHGNVTASGTKFNNAAMVAAHPTYPFGTVVRVTNLRNDRSVQVRIVDRGPVARLRKEGVIIDVSRAAAEKLGFISRGRTRVRVEVLDTPGGTS